MSEIMLDIETLGTRPGCVVLSVGAVEFSSGGLGHEFEINIDIVSSENAGLTIDADTLVWWMREGLQPLPNQVPVDFACKRFVGWLSPFSGKTRLWANSPSFDCAIWRHVIELLGYDPGWKFRQERDMRTAVDILGCKKPAGGENKHNALADAKRQAITLIDGGLFRK